MKRMIKYLLGVVASVFLFSMTAFAAENDIYLFDADEYMIAETDIIMYTTEYRLTPANIGLRIVGITNKGNFVVKNSCEDCYLYETLTPDKLSPTFNPAYGTQIDQATAYERLIALKTVFPEGMSWTEANTYDWTIADHNIYSPGIACSAYAQQVSDLVFGVDAPVFSHRDFDNIKVGDILKIYGEHHATVVLEVHDNYVIMTEGNYNGTVHWERKVSKTDLQNGNCVVVTRY